ncbi:PH domain-containing protein [Bifidobacterium vansinderenii]|uniref:Bacterial PH domain-containing protein n=1 Tax=Bifidobacterium vansinderenii TaxID=1984871 RepID=A0A229VV21_9BIFI|nr:PH domain-containing protein [Bifidobacterium vansinderenii]OXM99472.1 Bacterial PH domain-containing protein [Bifidobacterium vansinderenii]
MGLFRITMPAPDSTTCDVSEQLWHRTHPLSLILDIYGWGKRIIGFVVSMLVVFSRFHLSFRLICAITAATLIVGVICRVASWSARRYRLGDDALTVRSGLFTTTRTTIPYDHMHAVNVSSPIMLRPFGLVTVTVDSGGSSDGSSITLFAVPEKLPDRLEQLRRNATADCAMPTTDTVAGQRPRLAVDDDGNIAIKRTLVFRASTRDTLLFAVTDLGFLAALAVLYGFVQNLHDVIPGSVYDSAQDSVIRLSTHSTLSIVLTIMLVLASMLAVSIVRSLMRYYRFEVWRRGGELIIVRGLFTRRSVTIPVRRIQTITVQQSVLRRLLHLSSVQVGLATTGAPHDDEDKRMHGGILPVIADRRLYGTLRSMLPEWDLACPHIRRTARGLGRYLLLAPLLGTVIAVAAIVTGVMAFASFRASHSGMSMSMVTLSGGTDPDSLMGSFRIVWLLWLALIPVLFGGRLCLCRWLKLRSEGYELLDSERIVVTGARGAGFVTMFTHRSRIQCVLRRVLPWRLAAGVESLDLPLFVMNGYSWLRFSVIRSGEAQRLHDWAADVEKTAGGPTRREHSGTTTEHEKGSPLWETLESVEG